jgi:acetyltransferase-like isoleucine patch superfamily enzyme
VRALSRGLAETERPFRAVGRGLRWHLLPYLRSCYLTLRYVDNWSQFPAIRVLGPFRFRVYKERRGQLNIHGQLRVNFFPGANTASMLYIAEGARIQVENTFEVGENVRINLARRALLEIGGQGDTHYSGMTNNCTVYVKRRVRIGKDAVLAWKTLVMDSDWHPTNGRLEALDTEVGDNTWVCPNAHVLKGARIGRDSVVATGAVVLAGEHKPKSLLAGMPAKRIAQAPDWRYEWYEL